MKKIIIAFFVLLFSHAGLGQSDTGRSIIHLAYQLHKPAESVTIGAQVSVFFVNRLDRELYIEGPGTAIETVKISIQGNELTISNENSHTAYRPVVFLSSRLLKRIVINGQARVGNYGILQNTCISVHINSDCDLMIKTNGKLQISREKGVSECPDEKMMRP